MYAEHRKPRKRKRRIVITKEHYQRIFGPSGMQSQTVRAMRRAGYSVNSIALALEVPLSTVLRVLNVRMH